MEEHPDKVQIAKKKKTKENQFDSITKWLFYRHGCMEFGCFCWTVPHRTPIFRRPRDFPVNKTEELNDSTTNSPLRNFPDEKFSAEELSNSLRTISATQLFEGFIRRDFPVNNSEELADEEFFRRQILRRDVFPKRNSPQRNFPDEKKSWRGIVFVRNYLARILLE